MSKSCRDAWCADMPLGHKTLDFAGCADVGFFLLFVLNPKGVFVVTINVLKLNSKRSDVVKLGVRKGRKVLMAVLPDN